ncbi:MAG: glycosyltransferase family 1 protein [Vulcanimicrobiaceae bacterium]
MRVGIDVRLAGGHSGIARYIDDFVGALHELDAGDEIVLFGSSESSPVSYDLPYEPLAKNFAAYYAFALPRALRERKIDAFLGLSIFCPPGAGCRTVTVLYDTYSLKLHEWLPAADVRTYQAVVQRCKAELRMFAMRASDAILCISQNTRDDLAFAPRLQARASVVYPDASRKFSPEHGPTRVRTDTILYVGAFNRQKGVETLVAAHAAYVRATGGTTRLQLAGRATWPHVDLAATIAAAGVGHLVDVIPSPSDERIIDLYRTCGVFAYLSHYEGFGLPALEAIRCGAAVVVSDRSSLREVVPFVDSRADPTSVDDVARKIAFAFERRDDVARRQFDHARKFSWHRSALAARDLLAGV